MRSEIYSVGTTQGLTLTLIMYWSYQQ